MAKWGGLEAKEKNVYSCAYCELRTISQNYYCQSNLKWGGLKANTFETISIYNFVLIANFVDTS